MHTHLGLFGAILVTCLGVPAASAGAQAGGDPVATAARSARRALLERSYTDRIPAGAASYVLDSTAIMESAGETFSAVLAARIPGLSVLRPGGGAAEGSRVRLRGPHSLLT